MDSSAPQNNEELSTVPVPRDDSNIRESSSTADLPNDSNLTLSYSQIIFIVDGVRFAIERSSLVKHPDTMLGRMFTTGLKLAQPNHDGEFEVADGMSSEVFAAALEFYKSGQIKMSAEVSIAEVREACNYLLIPFDPKLVQSDDLCGILHEVSNDGARAQFEVYLKDLLYPAMLASADRGDRQCHIIVLREEDEIQWSLDFPPQMGEEYFQVVHSTALFRFFKYIENREVAKQVLIERGLKKIRCGIEGYPTTVEKIRRRGSGRAEGIYNYVQRPFVEISWQKEEAKSRHVDFQCIKTKSVSSLAEANADPDLVVRQALNGSYSNSSGVVDLEDDLDDPLDGDSNC